MQLKLLKKKKEGGENCMYEKEKKNAERAFKIASVVSIKYVHQLAMAHCDLAIPKHCLQGTVNRIRKHSFTKKFLVLLKLKSKDSPTLPITYTKR